MTKDNFEAWFEHIDHFMRHTIVPVGEEQTTTDRYETRRTHIKYRFATCYQIVTESNCFVVVVVEHI